MVSEKDDFNEMSLDELIERCKQIKELLAHLEDEYRSAAITEASYKQAKGTNTKKLEQIRKKLEEFGVKDDDAPPLSAPKADAKPPQSATTPSGLNPAANQAPVQVPTSPAPAAPASGASVSAAPVAAPAQKSSIFSQLKNVIALDKNAAAQAASAAQPQPPAIFAPAQVPASVASEIHRVEEKFSVELERIKTTLDAAKEAKSATDERLQRMTENIAELRSMIFQRETVLKGYDIKIEKLGETMADIEPQKITKEFNKRDKVSGEAEARIEKLERKAEDMMKTINETNALLKSIGGLQNIAEVDHEMMKKLAHMQEMTTSVERFSEKTEKMFIEVNKKLEEFTVYKLRQENLEEIAKDLVKNVDRMGLKFENYLERKELDAFRNSAGNVEKQFEIIKKAMKRAVPFIEAEIPKEILDMQREKEDVELLISGINFEFQQKRMSEKDYIKALEKNRAKIAEIDARLKDAIDRLSEEEKAKEEAKAAGKAAPAAKSSAQNTPAPAATATAAASNPAKPQATADADAAQKSPAKKGGEQKSAALPAAKTGAPAQASAPAKGAPSESAENEGGEDESEDTEGSSEEDSGEEAESGEGGETENEEGTEESADAEEQEQDAGNTARTPAKKHFVRRKSKKAQAKKAKHRKQKKAAHAKAKSKSARDPDAGMLKRLLRYNDDGTGKKQAAGKRSFPGKEAAKKVKENSDYLEIRVPREHHEPSKKKTAAKSKPKKSSGAHKRKTAQKKTVKAKIPKKRKIEPKPKAVQVQTSKPAPKPSAFGSLGSIGSFAQKPTPAPARPAAKPPAPSVPKLADSGKKIDAVPVPKPAESEDNSALVAELEASYKKGEITKEAYQHTKKMLLGK